MSSWRKTEGGILVQEEIAGSWERAAKDRYVAHVDMLGMSQLTLRNPRLAWAAVSKMAEAKKRVFNLSFTVGSRDVRIRDHVAAFTFSDTILLFTKGDEEADLRAMLIVCLELFAQVLHGSIPVRVGIARGLFVFNQDEDLFVGPPLVKAYEIGEAAQWIGAVLEGSVAERARDMKPELLSGDGLPLVVEWEVPVRSGGSTACPVLAWPRSHRDNFTIPLPISVEDFYRAFQQFFGPLSNLRPSDQQKYENTVAFVNEMLRQS
jgi:hypothetical protein